jgi:hypothetical protein
MAVVVLMVVWFGRLPTFFTISHLPQVSGLQAAITTLKKTKS